MHDLLINLLHFKCKTTPVIPSYSTLVIIFIFQWRRTKTEDTVRPRPSLLFGGTEFIQFLAALAILLYRMIWRKVWIHPILHIVLVQFILFFKSSWYKIHAVANETKKWNDSAPRAAATTFALSSVFILLLCPTHFHMIGWDWWAPRFWLARAVRSTGEWAKRMALWTLTTTLPHRSSMSEKAGELYIRLMLRRGTGLGGAATATAFTTLGLP